MEESEFDNILDDWFIESLKTYKDLHVYQLEHPTRVIEWTSGKTVCVAGYAPSKNEILELLLPLKLLADENKVTQRLIFSSTSAGKCHYKLLLFVWCVQGLCAERDFKVAHGGFTDDPVRCLKHIPGSRHVVTNDGRSSDLQVWDLGGDDSDVIRRTGSIEGKRTVSESGSRIAARLSPQPEVLHGAQSSNVHLTELTSGRTLFTLETDSAHPLMSLQFVSDSVFLTGCCNGSVYVADTRSSAAPQLSPAPASSAPSDLWWTDASAGLLSCRIVRLSSSGRAVVSDLRKLGGAVSQAQLDVQSRQYGLDDVTVSWAPVLDDCIAVSGFSGVVQIFNTSSWRSEVQDALPLFEHRGHTVSSQAEDGAPVVVTSHTWHPERPRTLLSAASDGSVHVWDWVDQSVASR
ncbi:WD repeat-containing protein 73 isoform X2 [Cheilinus undulatus]|uniref:WD repeat-containing protein 73 isoform X2 n=1 Tax=Cheilinus undulatus TaxID=241271 RepID=UPI001BD6BE66|nr:WD repeat-containing protein 73 isoform X2 [Cheilinus undulatus]